MRASLALERAGFRLDAVLAVERGGATALFGASGAGKTTLLRCLAGLERAPRATVALGASVWQDEARGLFVPAHRRPLGYVFQEPSLFPHLSVRANLEYGLRRVPRGGRRVALDDAVAWLGLERLLERAPATLSGGEQQRAAVARALLASPELLLLDEPLAALDEPARRELAPLLERVISELGVPTLYVSHSLRELARLCERLVWLDAGRVRASGPLAEVASTLEFARERGDEAEALIDGVVAEHDEAFELSAVDGAWGRIWVRRLERPLGSRARVQVLARDVSLGLAPESGSTILNELPARVAEACDAGPGQMLVRLVGEQGAALLARVTRRSYARLELGPGKRVYARVKSASLLE